MPGTGMEHLPCATMPDMSFNAGGPNGPNVPPPPGQGGGPYGGGPSDPGQPYGSVPPEQGQPQPYGAQPGAPEQKKGGLSKVIIGAIIGAVLLLVLCCGGALLLMNNSDDDPAETSTTTSETTTEPTSETTSEPTSETTSEPTSETTSGTASGESLLPEEFDGWKKSEMPGGVPATGGDLGVYEKGGDRLTVVVVDDMPGMIEGMQSLWSDEESVGDASCGKHQNLSQCARPEGDKIILVTHGGSAADAAEALEAFIDEF